MNQNDLNAYKQLDPVYTALDREQIRRTRNIRLIPTEQNRRGGKYSYAEWAHVIGIFQTLLCLHLGKKSGNRLLDAGCGTGLLGIASEPYLGDEGQYVGIDVMKKDIEFCREHFDAAHYSFIHLDVMNPMYAPQQGEGKPRWPVEDASFDAVTALSVWTHLDESDAIFYFREIDRVLAPGGVAVVTFFLMDEAYHESLPLRTEEIGRYHGTPQTQWIFDTPAYGSDNWFHPAWAEVPENAIGMTLAGLECMLDGTGLKQREYYPGNWKEIPGVFFQDVIVFEKT